MPAMSEPSDGGQGAVAARTVEAERDWSRRATMRGALVQIAVAAVLLGVVVYVVYQRGADRRASTEQIERARAALRLDAPLELRAVVDALKPAFASSTRRADAHAVAARAFAELAVVHQLPFGDQARAHLAEALTGDSQVEERHSAEALVLLLDGKADAALALLDGLKAKGIRRADLEYARARALLAKGDVAGMGAALEAAAGLSPREPRYFAALGDALLAQGELNAADAAYRKALAANAAHPGARLGVAMVLAQRGTDPAAAQQALAAFRATGELSPALERRAASVEVVKAVAADAVP